LVDGLRIDHVDGLRDPGGYCRRLRALMQRAGAHRPADLGHDGYLVVEKILAAGEPLRRDWPVHGTSGYDFMEQVGLLMHDPDGSHALTAQWQALDPACREDFPQLVLRARRETLARDFSADLQRTLQALAALLPVNAADPLLRSAVVALVEHFPVYR